MQKKKLTAFLTSLILLSAVFVSPAFASSDIRIAGNGSNSDSSVRVNEQNDVTVRQTNDTNISNNVSVDNNTGHNSISGNTGGDVTVRTGDATSNVDISNVAGSNVAHINGCCDDADTNINIEGNGSRSENSVHVSKDADLTVTQHNATDINNDVDVRNNTGFNALDDNTWGDVSLQTGDARSDVNISNEAGKNVLNIDGCCNGSDLSVNIKDNGSKSDNSVHYGTDKDSRVNQDNNTDFKNDVDSHNNTGYNHTESDNHFPWGRNDNHGKTDDRHDSKKDDHKYDKDRKYPVVKFSMNDYDHEKKDRDRKDDQDRYDHDKKSSYKKDFDFGHEKKFYPVTKNVDHNTCDDNYWKDAWKGSDWDWYHKNCQSDHDKKFVFYPVSVKDYNHDQKDDKRHNDYDKKNHDSDHHKDMSYKKDRDSSKDHGKNNDGKRYSLVKYPSVKLADSNRNSCRNGSGSKYVFSPRNSNYFPYRHGGNTGGNVNLHTGNAMSNVNLHNVGSSNFLSFI